MKFNKLIIGLGVLGLMSTSCDKAEKQDYTAAPGVATPPAYFAIDRDDEIVLEEEQNEFTIPVYRATTEGEATVALKCTISDNANGHFTIPESVNFPAGEGEADIVIKYDWDWMKTQGGVPFEFSFALAGESSPYFDVDCDYVVTYVPWTNVVGPEGGTQSYFVDEYFWAGWGVDTPIDYPVEVQWVEGVASMKGMYRVLTPYASCPHIGGEGQGIYTGGDKVNIMYINAKDPANVYLCDKTGKPSPNYDTYYTMSEEYGNVSYWDRVSGYLKDEVFEYGGKKYRNSEGESKYNGTFDEENNYILFPEGHFFCYFGLEKGQPIVLSGTDQHNQLRILLPDGKLPAEWEELGEGTYTDNFISLLNKDLLDNPITIGVTVEQSLKDANVIRMVNPYIEDPIWENTQEGDYNIAIDLTNPDVVKLDLQETGYTSWYKKHDRPTNIINQGAYITLYAAEGEDPLTDDEVVKQGVNDLYKDGVIDIKHPIYYLPADESQDVKEAMFTIKDAYVKLVMPTEETGQTSYATKAAKNNGKYIDGTRSARLSRTIKPTMLHTFAIDRFRCK